MPAGDAVSGSRQQ